MDFCDKSEKSGTVRYMAKMVKNGKNGHFVTNICHTISKMSQL